MADKFKPIFALVAALLAIAADAASLGLPLEIKETAGGGWRFGNEAISVELSGRTGWPVAWDVGGRRAMSYADDPSNPWEISYLPLDGKGDLLHTGKVKVKSVKMRGDGVVCISESDGWLVALHLSLDAAGGRAVGKFGLRRADGDDVRLKRFRVRSGRMPFAESGGEVLAPARWPPTRVSSEEMRKGTVVGSWKGACPLIAADGAGATVTWIMNQFLPYGDLGSAKASWSNRGVEAMQTFFCEGYARKGDSQKVGDLHILFGKGDVDAALGNLPRWFKDVGQVAPKDVPEWLDGAVLYTISPKGTRDTDRNDGRGFAGIERYLDAISALGCNTIWLQPIEDRAPYHPRDYRKLQTGIGSVDEYKSLVAAAHKRGMRFWNDIVPHGGGTNNVRFAEHPEWFAVKEDGTVSDYWGCDFNWPGWAEYMADVADWWMRLGGIDGFRVDAAFGTRYANWNPDVPYARASFARLQGGFRMQRALRSAVERANPQGAILAEAEPGAFNATADATWDFELADKVLLALREGTAEEVVPRLRRWLHERKLTLPPGSRMLRYVEIHDNLRASDVYGNAASAALAALVAWIGECIPVVNDGMEERSFEALRRIFAIRRSVPELCGGASDYLAPSAPPGVFACLRTGPGVAVPVVNLNGRRVKGEVALPDGRKLPFDLPPLGFDVLLPGGVAKVASAPYVFPGVAAAESPRAELVGCSTNSCGETVRTYRLRGCTRWFAHTAEGTFESPVFPHHGDRRRRNSPFYRFKRGGDLLWDGSLHPFGFTAEHSAFGGVGSVFAVVAVVDDPDAKVSLLDSFGGVDCLHAEVISTKEVSWRTVPAPEVRPPEVGTGDPRLLTVVGGWLFDDGLFRVHIQRNGAVRGVWRREDGAWRKLSGAICVKAEGETTYDQGSDVEPVATLRRLGDGTILLSFEGEIRNIRRSGKMPHGTSYHTVCSVGGASGVVIETSFKADPASGVSTTVDCEVKPEREIKGDAEVMTWRFPASLALDSQGQKVYNTQVKRA